MKLPGYYIRLRNFVSGKTLKPLKSEIPSQGYKRDCDSWLRRPKLRYAKKRYRQYDLTASEEFLFQNWDDLEPLTK